MTKTVTELDVTTAPTKWNKLSGRIRVITSVAIIISICAAVYGWQWWNNGRFMENTEDAYVGGEITVISSKVPGYIVSETVTDNQVVHAGDLLVKLDDRDYRAALEKAESSVKAQQALIANLDATRS